VKAFEEILCYSRDPVYRDSYCWLHINATSTGSYPGTDGSADNRCTPNEKHC
jgi:hypothetical protein